MKSLKILITCSLFMAACSRVTTIPDKNTTTSGTLGSVKATDRLPTEPIDTTLRPGDSVNIARDSVPK